MYTKTIALVLALGLCGCGEDRQCSPRGWVVSKQHTGAYTTMIMVGKVWVPQFHPATWTVRYRDLNGPESEDSVCQCGAIEQDWNMVRLHEVFDCSKN